MSAGTACVKSYSPPLSPTKSTDIPLKSPLDIGSYYSQGDVQADDCHEGEKENLQPSLMRVSSSDSRSSAGTLTTAVTVDDAGVVDEATALPAAASLPQSSVVSSARTTLSGHKRVHSEAQSEDVSSSSPQSCSENEAKEAEAKTGLSQSSSRSPSYSSPPNDSLGVGRFMEKRRRKNRRSRGGRGIDSRPRSSMAGLPRANAHKLHTSTVSPEPSSAVVSESSEMASVSSAVERVDIKIEATERSTPTATAHGESHKVRVKTEKCEAYKPLIPDLPAATGGQLAADSKDVAMADGGGIDMKMSDSALIADGSVDESSANAQDTFDFERDRPFLKTYNSLGERSPEVGEVWYVVESKWFDRFDAFRKQLAKELEMDGKQDTSTFCDELSETVMKRPEPVDNRCLLQFADSGKLKLKLRRDVNEGSDFNYVHKEQWTLMQTWFGGGGPEIARPVFESKDKGNNEGPFVCGWPLALRMGPMKTDRTIDKRYVKRLPIAPNTRLEELLAIVTKKWFQGHKVRLWMPFGMLKSVYLLDRFTLRVKAEDLCDEDANRYVCVPPDALKLCTLDTLDAVETGIIGIEKRTSVQTDSGPVPAWCCDPTEVTFDNVMVGERVDIKGYLGVWKPGFVRLVAKDRSKIIIHFDDHNTVLDKVIDRTWQLAPVGEFTGSNASSPRRSPTPRTMKTRSMTYSSRYGGDSKSSSKHRSAESWRHTRSSFAKPGVVGLKNLGNTCFMNSTIQCMAQTPNLMRYFVDDDYTSDINEDNPLGHGGSVATAWAELLKDMHSGDYSTVEPSRFKYAIGRVAPRFMGYRQQDSQELLSFLLDGLHEDLNRVKQKPYTESIESGGRPDAEVARESWHTHLLRNQSIVVDLLQGQFKSRVQCPDCDNVSITFDPYMFVSVPLPQPKRYIEFTFMSFLPAAVVMPTGFRLALPSNVRSIGGLSKWLANDEPKLRDTIQDPSHLFVCWVNADVGNIHRCFRENTTSVDVFKSSRAMVIYNIPPRRPVCDPKPITCKKEAAGVKVVDDGGIFESLFNAGSSVDSLESEGSFEQSDDGKGEEEMEPHPFELKLFLAVTPATEIAKRMQICSLAAHLDVSKPFSGRQLFRTVFEYVRPFVAGELSQEVVESQIIPGLHMLIELKARNHWTGEQLKYMVKPDSDELLKKIGRIQFVNLYFSAKCPLDNRFFTNAIEDESMERNKDLPKRTHVVSLNDCFETFAKEETLGEDDAWFCGECKDHKRARKRMDLWNCPDVLIIHLKRFCYNRQRRRRIGTLVDFPVEGLDISAFVEDECFKKDAIYDLYAVSNHMGDLGGGHYTAYSKNLHDSHWYLCDDSSTSRVGEVQQRVVSKAAYVLYYKRREMREPVHCPAKDKPQPEEEETVGGSDAATEESASSSTSSPSSLQLPEFPGSCSSSSKCEDSSGFQ